jgi:acetyl-CoA carboxylase carboxyl transferase subunit alpha
MATTFMDFEKPLEALYEQLDKLKEVGEQGEVDVTMMVRELEQKIASKKSEIYANLTGWQRVQLSRHPERPYTLFYLNTICKKFIELHGDRYAGDDKAIVGGLADIDGQTVMVIGHQKGTNTKMRQYRNFGMANPEGYRKALRLMKMAERFGFPVVTLIDTPGAFPGLEAEQRGQAEAIARNLFEMAQLKVPIICYIIGEGASGGALGIGLGDKADSMLSFGLIDGIVEEPIGGAHNAPETMAITLKAHILKELSMLVGQDPEERIMTRIRKYEQMGRYDHFTPEVLAKDQEKGSKKTKK